MLEKFISVTALEQKNLVSQVLGLHPLTVQPLVLRHLQFQALQGILQTGQRTPALGLTL